MITSSSAPRRQAPPRPRWRLLLFPLVLAAIVLAMVALYELRSPALWRTELDRYLDQHAVQSLTLITVVSARHPDQMQSASGFVPLDESVYYRAQPVATGELVGSDGRRPLPYPPSAIQCVTLADGRGERHVLLIARHADLYNADWLVYETAGDGEDVEQTLAKIGCAG